jgi:two-component system, NarL family, nitrate/nitrite response regulator NarL
MRVLICDDHVVFAESLAHLLRGLGTEVVATTYHPDQALAVLRREPVDVCLLDVMFETFSVLDRLPDIRCAAPRCHVMLLSGRVDGQVLAASQTAGVQGVADKRLPVAEILRILDRVHAGERVMSAVATASPALRSAHRNPAGLAQQMAAFLTPRERQVLGALVRGQDTTRLARELGIAGTTARCHIQSVLSKLGAHSRLEAATTAVRFGMVNPETGRWLLPVDRP